MDPHRSRKDILLARLNKEYRIESGQVIRINGITKEKSDNSIKSLEDTRTEYIERLKQRIKQLESGDIDKSKESIESSNRSFDSLQSAFLEPERELDSRKKGKPATLERIPKERIQRERIASPEPTLLEETPISQLKHQQSIAEQDKSMKLVACANCGRKFRSERIAVHQSTCSKVKKQRPKFDEQKMRLKNTEMENYHKSRYF
jgi:predicted Zn-ribbon and HTH transcriptional regulator